MEVIGKSKNIRMSARKLRLVADEIKKLPLPEMEIALENLNKRAAQPLLWVLRQAIANAENNFSLKGENLKLKSLEIGEGPRMKRYRFVGRGRVHSIVKKTSHIRMVLEEKQEEKIQTEVSKKTDSKEQKKKEEKKTKPKIKKNVKKEVKKTNK